MIDCSVCGGTGYVRYRPAETQSHDDYIEMTCSHCLPARSAAWFDRLGNNHLANGRVTDARVAWRHADALRREIR